MLPNLAALRLTPTGANDGEASSPDSKRQKVDGEEGEGAGAGSGSAEMSIVDGLAIEEVLNRDAAALDAQSDEFEEGEGEAEWQPEDTTKPKPYKPYDKPPPEWWLEECRKAYRASDFEEKKRVSNGVRSELWPWDVERWPDYGSHIFPVNLSRGGQRVGPRDGSWIDFTKPAKRPYKWEINCGAYVEYPQKKTVYEHFATLEQALAAMYWTQKKKPEDRTYEDIMVAFRLESEFAKCLQKEFDAMPGYDMHILNEGTKADILVKRSADDDKWWQVQLKVSNRWCGMKRWAFAWNDGNYDGMMFLCHAPDGPKGVPRSWFYDGALFGKGRYVKSGLTISAGKGEEQGKKWDTVGWTPTRLEDEGEFNSKTNGKLLLDKCDEAQPESCKAAAKMLVDLLEEQASKGWLTSTTKAAAARHFASESHAKERESIEFLMSKYGYKEPPLHQLPYDLVETRDDGTEVKFQVKSRTMWSMQKQWAKYSKSGVTFSVSKNGGSVGKKVHVAYKKGDYDDLIFLLFDEQARGWHEWRLANAPTVMNGKTTLTLHFPKEWFDKPWASGGYYGPLPKTVNRDAAGNKATYIFTPTA